MDASQLSKLIQYIEEAIALTTESDAATEVFELLTKASCVAENLYMNIGNMENGEQQLPLNFDEEA